MEMRGLLNRREDRRVSPGIRVRSTSLGLSGVCRWCGFPGGEAGRSRKQLETRGSTRRRIGCRTGSLILGSGGEVLQKSVGTRSKGLPGLRRRRKVRRSSGGANKMRRTLLALSCGGATLIQDDHSLGIITTST